MAKRLKPLGTTRLGTTPTPDGVGFLVSRVVLVAVPRLSTLCLVVSLNELEHAAGMIILLSHPQFINFISFSLSFLESMVP